MEQKFPEFRAWKEFQRWEMGKYFPTSDYK